MIKAKDVYKYYSLRWSIELLFKSFKSEMDFDTILGFKEKRVLFELYSKFLSIIIFTFFNKGILLIFGNANEIILDKSLTKFRHIVKDILENILSVKKLVLA